MAAASPEASSPRPSTATSDEPTTDVSASAPGVQVELSSTSLTSRTLAASVEIAAPVDVVWAALTDYDRLGAFIPNLAENRCLQRRPNGALLYQVRWQGDGGGVGVGVQWPSARRRVACRRVCRSSSSSSSSSSSTAMAFVVRCCSCEKKVVGVGELRLPCYCTCADTGCSCTWH